MNIVSISQKIMKLGFIIALAGQLILATRTAPVAGALGETAEAATNTTPEPSDFCD